MPFNYVNGTMVILVDNSTGTALDLGTGIDTCSPVGKQVDELEVTVFADTAERFIRGIEKSRQVTLGGLFNSTVGSTIPDNHYATLVGTIQTIEFAPAGTAAGKRKLIAEFLAVSYQVITVNKQVVRWEAVHRMDGTMNNTGTY